MIVQNITARIHEEDCAPGNGCSSEVVSQDMVQKAVFSGGTGHVAATVSSLGISRDLQEGFAMYLLFYALIFFATFGGIFFILCCCTSFCFASNISNSQNNTFTNSSPIYSNNQQQSNADNTEGGRRSDPMTEQEREERRAFILTNIVTMEKKAQSSSSEVWKDDNDDYNAAVEDKTKPEGTDASSGSMRSLRNFFRHGRKSNSVYKDDVCSICLEGYNENDEICCSKNEKCPHTFHLDCMMGWLMDHDECPVCRLPYLVVDTDGINADSIP